MIGTRFIRLARVFPAYAGMSRKTVYSARELGGFPRLRGDEPAGILVAGCVDMFSPPTRG